MMYSYQDIKHIYSGACSNPGELDEPEPDL